MGVLLRETFKMEGKGKGCMREHENSYVKPSPRTLLLWGVCQHRNGRRFIPPSTQPASSSHRQPQGGRDRRHSKVRGISRN